MVTEKAETPGPVPTAAVLSSCYFPSHLRNRDPPMGRPHSATEGLSLCYQHEHELQGAMSWDPGCLESFSLGKETGKEEWSWKVDLGSLS